MHAVLYNRASGALALIGLVLAFLLPADGLGVDLCWFYSATGLPCPGCGLTRSVTNIAHFEPAMAWRYNPFGFAAFGLMLSMVFFALMPQKTRDTAHKHLETHKVGFQAALFTMLAALMFFGVGRLIHHLWVGHAFPPAP